MTDPDPNPSAPVADPAAAAPEALPAPRRRAPAARWAAAGLAALAVAIALAAWLDARQSQRALREEVAQRLAAVEAGAQVLAKAQVAQGGEIRDAQAKATLLEARIAESQAQQAALEALYRDLAPSRDEIALTEIEQVLLIASQQLQLAGNVPSALTALQLADAKLQRLDRPQFLPLRRALARDIDRLKAIPFVDVQGMSVKLDAAIAGVDALPLAMDERLPAPPPSKAPPVEPAWQRLLRDLWADVRQLVRVEVADRPAAPLVPPAQQYYLRENLKLRLLSARIALQNRDDATFRADVAAADAWVRQYYDLRAKPVQALQATLRQLAATPAAAPAPDLAASLEALRVLRLAQDRAPGRAGADRAAR